MKYLDPKSYLRAAPANSYDVDLASRLAFSLAHHTMAGYTEFGCGIVREQIVAIPFNVFIIVKQRKIARKDPDWQAVLASTGQSNYLNAENYQYALELERKD